MSGETLTIFAASDRQFRTRLPDRVVNKPIPKRDESQLILEYPRTPTGWVNAAWAAVNLYISGNIIHSIEANPHVPYDDQTWKFSTCKPIHTIQFGEMEAHVRLTRRTADHTLDELSTAA